MYSELQSIGETYTPQDVVDFARSKDTELHKCFTWDNTVAAEKWRKQEARVLIANIVYVKDEETHEPSHVRAVVYSDNDKEFKPLKFVVKKQDEYEQLLERASAELDAFKRKYSVLGNLQEILALIGEDL